MSSYPGAPDLWNPLEGVPPGHDVVTNPTWPQPGFTLPRRRFVTLNRLRCGQARCAESLYRWGVIASPTCPCGERVSTHCIPWRLATSTRSGSRRSEIVIKTVYETVTVFQTNINNIGTYSQKCVSDSRIR